MYYLLLVFVLIPKENNIRDALILIDNIFKSAFAMFVSSNIIKLERGLSALVSFKMCKMTRNSIR